MVAHWLALCMLPTSEPKMVIYFVKQALVHSFSYALSDLAWKSPTQWSKH